METIKDDVYFVGANDYRLDLFESHFKINHGMSYNSYVIVDEKIAIVDSTDISVKDKWINNIKEVLKGRKPDYLIVQHMEPDHSANIVDFLKEYPDTIVVSRDLTFNMIKNYFRDFNLENKLEVKEGDELSLGKHVLKFIYAPMIHWPEVIMTFDTYSKILFSADAFGKFGALDYKDKWIDEARRYYFGIVGKYGFQVQQLFKKASNLDIQTICPLHGPVLNENLVYYLNLYDLWSKYEPENNGVLIAYTSVYGHTKEAAKLLEKLLKEKNVDVEIYDLARDDLYEAVGKAFEYKNIVLATTTYNMSIFPPMYDFLHNLIERNFQNRNVALIQNGSWAPTAIKVMKDLLANQKGLNFIEPTISIFSSLSDLNKQQIGKLAEDLSK